MKRKIFYFTGTGNSLMAVKAISIALGDTDIASIPQFQNEGLDKSFDTLGLVFPVYWEGLPLKVLKFLATLKEYKGSYIFAVATHAGDPGQVLSQLRLELQKIGLDLSAGFLLRMPTNYIIRDSPPTAKSIQTHLDNADQAITEMVDIIKNKTIDQPSSELFSYSSSYQPFLAAVNSSDEKFWVDESCTECEVCIRVCPVQNIRMNESRPEWLHQCEQCLACINWCPERAIQFGTGTESRGRYTNPRVTVEEMEL